MKTTKKHVLSALIFIIYSAILIKVMVFKDVPTIRLGHLMLNFGGTESGHSANFMPFKTILPYLLGYKGWIIAGINLVGNIALLIPIGFLLPFTYRKITWKRSIATAVVFGLAIETMQTILHVGIFDIDDVILNALGVMIGYWAGILLVKWVRERKYVHIIIVTILLIAAVTGAIYAIYPKGQPLVNSRVNTDVNQNGDLCGNTGGTGEIISQRDHTITIKRKDGVVQVINLTNRTTIKASSGPISESDLKIGDHVTLVVHDNMTASDVLVCDVLI